MRQKRLEMEYSQDYMAEKLGISQPHYGRLERGDCHVTAEQLIAISKLLKATLDEITEGALPCK